MGVHHRLLGSITFLSFTVWAGVSTAQDVVLDEILVTGGREPVSSEKVGRAHTVLTSKQLEDSQSLYVADALRQVPGLAVSRTGAVGGLTQVRLRGAEGNHVLVLVDGIEVSELSSGEFDFGGLAVADIDRIEVLRGPQSALWGSNALAGVIHIVTKSGSRGGFEYGARSEGGTDGTALVSGYLRGGEDKYDYALSGIFRRSDGFNISDFGSEKDGDYNTTLNFKGSADLAPWLTFDATARYVFRETDTDDQDFAFPATPTQGLVIDSDDQSTSEEFYTGFGLNLDTLDGLLTHVARFEITDVTRKNISDDVRSSASTGTRYHASYQASANFETPDFLSAVHTLTGAFEFEHENFRALRPVFDPTQLDKRSRNLFGFIGEYRGEFFDSLFLSAAVRHDDNDRFRDATTFSVSGAYIVPEFETRLHGSVGTGVTNPSFFEQFGFIPASFIGNPNLRPERSFAWDIGVEQPLLDGQLVVDVTYFNARLKDEIQTNFVGFATTPVNLNGTSTREGIEVGLTAYPLDDLTVRASYTYTDAEEPSGLQEVRRPHHAAAVNVSYAFADGRGNAFVDAIYNGEMEDLEFINATPQTRVTLDDYTVVNIGGSFRITETTQVYGRVENLFDEVYEEVFGFNTRGITAFFGVRVDLGGPGGQ